MRKIFYVFPFLFLLAACGGRETVEFTIKDKFIIDVVMIVDGTSMVFKITDEEYSDLIDPSYKVFIEFDFRGRTFQKTCEIDEVYWRQIQQGQVFSRKTNDGPRWSCGHLTRAIYIAFKQQPNE